MTMYPELDISPEAREWLLQEQYPRFSPLGRRVVKDDIEYRECIWTPCKKYLPYYSATNARVNAEWERRSGFCSAACLQATVAHHETMFWEVVRAGGLWLIPGYDEFYRRFGPPEVMPEPTDCTERRKSKVRAGDRIPRRLVFKADGYICHICGLPTDPSKQHPHRLAPVVDHIDPLAREGEHRIENLACAHSYCNASKSAKSMDDIDRAALRAVIENEIRAESTLRVYRTA